MLEEVTQGIYRIRIPFDNIETTAFVLTNADACLIFDSGCHGADAEMYILPTITALGLPVRYLVASHAHEDHCGGMARLIDAYPQATVINKQEHASAGDYDGTILLSRYMLLCLPGHSEDCLGILDLQGNTLLSGDALQMYGVGKYRTHVESLSDYERTLDRVAELKIQTILCSHEFEPLGAVVTDEEVHICLQHCREAARRPTHTP